MAKRKNKNGVFAVHAFVATREMTCAVCGDIIPRSGHYIQIEPSDRKRASFVACLRCGGKVKKSGGRE